MYGTRVLKYCITDSVEVTEVEKKGRRLNTLEEYHIYRLTRSRLHMNDAYVDIYNPIFETLQELDTR